MVLSNQFHRLDNQTLVAVTTKDYLGYVKPLENLNVSEVVVRVLLEDIDAPMYSYLYEMWNLFEESLHFRSVYSYMDYSSGFDAVVVNRTADALLSPITMFYGWGVIHSPISTWYEIHVKQPRLIGSSTFYFTVLPQRIVILQIICVIVFPLLLWFLLKCTQGWRSSYSFTYVDCLLTTIAVFTSQGLQFVPRIYSMRLVALIILLYCFIMNSSYSAILIAKLSVAKPTLSFNSLEELAKIRTHQVCLNYEIYAEKFFLNENSNGYTPEWQNRVNGKNCPHLENGFLNLEALVPALCSKDIVSMTLSPPSLDHSKSSSSCKITKLSPRYYEDKTVPVIHKNFLLLKNINEKLILLWESGLANYMYSKHLTTYENDDNHSKKIYVLDLSIVYGIFIFYFIIAFIAFLLLVVEILTTRNKYKFLYID